MNQALVPGKKLMSSLALNCNFKISTDNYFTSLPVVDNYFTSLPVVDKLKGDGFLFTDTISPNRLKGSPLLPETAEEEWPVDHHLTRNRSITAVQWYDNRALWYGSMITKR